MKKILAMLLSEVDLVPGWGRGVVCAAAAEAAAFAASWAAKEDAVKPGVDDKLIPVPVNDVFKPVAVDGVNPIIQRIWLKRSFIFSQI